VLSATDLRPAKDEKTPVPSSFNSRLKPIWREYYSAADINWAATPAA
jgi:hypothetical protein